MTNMEIVLKPVNPELKRRTDAARIESMKSAGITHIYDYGVWREWTGNNYIKSWYDILLADGRIIYHVRPNAGLMRSGPLVFDEKSNVKVRLSEDFPY